MSEPRERARSFLHRHGMEPADFDLQAGLEEFLQEMRRGLSGEPSSLEMIPTYIELAASLPIGEPVIAVDAGGTNLRIALVRFDRDLKPVIENYRKVLMPGVEREVEQGGVLQRLRRPPAGLPAVQFAPGLLLLLLHGAAAEQGRPGEQPGQGGEGAGGAGRAGGREPGRRPAGGGAPAADKDRHRQRHGHRHAGRDGRLGGPRLRRVPGLHPGHGDEHLLPGGQPQHQQGAGPGPGWAAGDQHGIRQLQPGAPGHGGPGVQRGHQVPGAAPAGKNGQRRLPGSAGPGHDPSGRGGRAVQPAGGGGLEGPAGPGHRGRSRVPQLPRPGQAHRWARRWGGAAGRTGWSCITCWTG